ncbi:MAG: NAD-dependent epimerase/dehydratase family protein [Dehalococcoidia bacterium]|nr:NAD-dependent epimerase/dehydratase family protein [Dehalococcoidia bacterium]
MSILLTGGMGAIGSWVARELVEAGHRPVLYDSRADFTLIPDLAGKVDVVLGDLLDLPCLVRVVLERKIERIMHLAAMMPPQAQANPYLGFQVNALGTVHVLEAARIGGVRRVVYTSSKGVYGTIGGEHSHPVYRPLSEDYPAWPNSVYGATKLAGEHMGSNYRRNYGLDFVVLRFGSTYGPGKLVRHGTVGLHSRIIESAMAGQETHIPQGGEQMDDLVYNADAAHAVVLACFASASGGLAHGVFNIATGVGYTLLDLAQAAKKIFPQAVIEIGPGLDYYGGGAYAVFDISRARRELGYTPRYSLEAGVEHYVQTMGRLGIPPLSGGSA